VHLCIRYAFCNTFYRFRLIFQHNYLSDVLEHFFWKLSEVLQERNNQFSQLLSSRMKPIGNHTLFKGHPQICSTKFKFLNSANTGIRTVLHVHVKMLKNFGMMNFYVIQDHNDMFVWILV